MSEANVKSSHSYEPKAKQVSPHLTLLADLSEVWPNAGPIQIADLNGALLARQPVRDHPLRVGSDLDAIPHFVRNGHDRRGMRCIPAHRTRDAAFIVVAPLRGVCPPVQEPCDPMPELQSRL
jgi:hypothetical protein